MRIALIGSGAREHAIAHQLEKSPSVSSIVAIPGSEAMERTLTKVRIQSMPKTKEQLVATLENQKIELVIVGPEKPLVEGLTDVLQNAGIPVFGPTKAAARLEGSKEYAKDFMKRYSIPTAKYESFSTVADAFEYIEEMGAPIVIKADGLAAGKGVVVAKTEEEAKKAVEDMLVGHKFNCDRIVIEEFLSGEEATLLCFSDGKTVVPMIASQDHKQIFDNDEGPNTGGMGAYAPAPVMTEELIDQVVLKIVEPTIAGMAADGNPFVGCLYVGLMITEKGPKVIEYNVRFGDPETQVVLPLLDSDFGEILKACVLGKLAKIEIKWKKGSTACIVMASEGYPEAPLTGYLIKGNLYFDEDIMVFHGGTNFDMQRGQYRTAGGRVLGVSAYGVDLESAINKAYDRVKDISFKGMQYRSDIGKKGLRRLNCE